MGPSAEYKPLPLSDPELPISDSASPPAHSSSSPALTKRRIVAYGASALFLLIVVINLSSTSDTPIKSTGAKPTWSWDDSKDNNIHGEGGESVNISNWKGEPGPEKSGSKKPPTETSKGKETHKPAAKPSKNSTKAVATPSKKPTKADLPNPYLYGNYLDYLKPASQERYVTGIPLGGVNNQNKGVLSLLWLAKITNRTPILPPIIPNLHQQSLIRGPSYSTFYNLTRASSELGFPIIEWNNIRPDAPGSYKGIKWMEDRWREASNPLPCWVTSKMGGPKKDGGRNLAKPFAKGLLLSVKGIYAPGDKSKGAWQEMDTAANFLKTNSSTAVVSGTKVEKDLGCLTQSYWLKEPREGLHQMAMLEHMHFTDELESLVDDIIAKTLNTTPAKVRSGEARFITVHVRRGDIAQKCEPAPPNWEALRDAETGKTRRVDDGTSLPWDSSNWTTDDDDLDLETAPQSRMAKRKQRWQNCHLTDSFILRKINKVVNSLPGPAPSVLLTTDDKSEESLALWDSTQGIFRVSHPDVGKGRVGGEFWDVMVDAAILTRGEAFLGTSVSTMSRLAAERGKRWYGRPDSTF